MVEKALAELEGAVKGALQRIIANVSLSNDEDKGLLIYYMSLLLVKSPFVRPKIDQVSDMLAKAIGNAQAVDKASWDAKMANDKAAGIYDADFDGDAVRNAILEDKYTITLTTEAHLDLELNLARDLFPTIARRKWNILKAKEGKFITSDRPVALFWDDYGNHNPIGLGLTGTRLLFPLSPEIAICGGLEFRDSVLEFDAKRVASINGRTIMNAGRQVFACDESFEYYLPHNGGARSGRDLAKDAITTVKPAFQKQYL